MIYLISPHKKQYKANLHCHSTLSDGSRCPEELKELYKSHGYNILAITDHERPFQHQHLSDNDFIMLTGYECYIRPDPDGKYSRLYNKDVHLNLFAKDPMNVKLICSDVTNCHDLKLDDANKGLEGIGSEQHREYSRIYINAFIRSAREHGYLVAYNHPYWTMEGEEDVLSHEGIFSLEICNYSSYLENHLEYCGALYDKMLLAKRHIFCHGGDDNHNRFPVDHPNCDSFGAFTMIFPEEFTYSGVINAMENGEMYASMGPEFYEISLDGDNLHVECSEVAHIFVYTGSNRTSYLHALPEEGLTCADFKLDPKARFIRVSIRDKMGRWADTRGFFPEELGFASLDS